MRLIDADEIFYDQLLNTGHKEHPLEFAVSKKRIDDMPTIEPQQWIPMSEREPEYGNYIITFRKKDDPKDERDVTIDYYASYGWDDDGFLYETLAWMPLPEPWEGKDGE